jgi:hypothetical protein
VRLDVLDPATQAGLHAKYCFRVCGQEISTDR